MTTTEDQMLEVQLSRDPQNLMLVTFDGRVVETFVAMRSGGGCRYHLAQIAKIEITVDKKGRQYLCIASRYANLQLEPPLEIADQALAGTQALVAAIQQAMARYT